MKPPIAYYGGKQNLVKTILPLIPEHKTYIEPFFGGGAVFFAKPQIKHEIINDTDGRVVNLFKCMRDNFEELRHLVENSLHCEATYKEAKEVLKENQTGVKAAWAWWVLCNTSFSNIPGGGFAFSKDSKEARTVKSKRDRFKTFAGRFGTVLIFNRDALDVIKRTDHAGAFFYIDPPYVSSDCGHYKGYTEEDFRALLGMLSNIKGKFLLSSYPETALIEARKKHGWQTLDTTTVVNVTHLTNKTKTECLTFNYKLEQQTLFT